MKLRQSCWGLKKRLDEQFTVQPGVWEPDEWHPGSEIGGWCFVTRCSDTPQSLELQFTHDWNLCLFQLHCIALGVLGCIRMYTVPVNRALGVRRRAILGRSVVKPNYHTCEFHIGIIITLASTHANGIFNATRPIQTF